MDDETWNRVTKTKMRIIQPTLRIFVDIHRSFIHIIFHNIFHHNKHHTEFYTRYEQYLANSLFSVLKTIYINFHLIRLWAPVQFNLNAIRYHAHNK